MRDWGGFEHNLQSLRVVDTLEERYPDFDGLNLTFETREGVLKHCSRHQRALAGAARAWGVAQRFLLKPTTLRWRPRLANLADAIAYNAHDVDDGVRSGLITLEQLRSIPLFAGHYQQVLHDHPHLQAADQSRRLLYEAIRRMLSAQVYDVIATTQANIAAAGARQRAGCAPIAPAAGGLQPFHAATTAKR